MFVRRLSAKGALGKISVKRLSAKRPKGFMAAGMMFVLLAGLSYAMFTSISAEQSRNKLRQAKLQAYYLAESVVDISQSLILSGIEAKQVGVFYEYDDNGEISQLYSEPFYHGEPGIDFWQICDEALAFIFEENNGCIKNISCEIAVINKTPGELLFHSLDKNGALYEPDEFTAGELLPIDYMVTVAYANTTLTVCFTISGITFEIAGYGSSDDVIFGFSAANARITTTEFFVQ